MRPGERDGGELEGSQSQTRQLRDGEATDHSAGAEGGQVLLAIAVHAEDTTPAHMLVR